MAYGQGPCRPARPTAEFRGRAKRVPLAECQYFTLGRWDTARPFLTGAAGRCRVLAWADGRAAIRHRAAEYPLGPGDVWLLPAETGPVQVVPDGPAVILECGIPDKN